MPRAPRLARELEQLLDDAEDLVRLARTFVEMREPRWQGALDELQRLERLAGDGVALVIGARSEATISTRRAQAGGGAARAQAAAAKHRRGRTDRVGVATEPGAASSSAAANRAA